MGKHSLIFHPLTSFPKTLHYLKSFNKSRVISRLHRYCRCKIPDAPQRILKPPITFRFLYFSNIIVFRWRTNQCFILFTSTFVQKDMSNIKSHFTFHFLNSINLYFYFTIFPSYLMTLKSEWIKKPYRCKCRHWPRTTAVELRVT